MRFQKAGDAYIVNVKRSEFPGAKRHWPSEFPIGTISKSRGIDVWPHPYGAHTHGGKPPPGWHETASRVISHPSVRTRLFGAMKSERREEKSTGDRLVKLSDGRSSYFHQHKDAQAWAERKLKGMPPGSAAAFFIRGAYEKTPFQHLVKNEHGHVIMGRLDAWTRGGWGVGTPRSDPSRRGRSRFSPARGASRAHLSRSRLSLAQHEAAVRSRNATYARILQGRKDPRRVVDQGFDVNRVRLDKNGYDRTGRYWGSGQNLYTVTSRDTNRAVTLRAASAKAAKAEVLEKGAWKLYSRTRRAHQKHGAWR